MSTFPSKHQFSPLAINVTVGIEMLEVELSDGRIISVSLEWFPKLRVAKEEEKSGWRLIGGGLGSIGKSLMKTCQSRLY